MKNGADKLPQAGVRFVVRGRVQGVGFRWWTHREAVRLGMTGTVRNLTDGTVEAIAFGTPDQLGRLEQALRRGPPMSEVERLERTEAAPDGAPDDFTILR